MEAQAKNYANRKLLFRSAWDFGIIFGIKMESARRLHLIEIKCAMTPNPSLERGIGRVSSVTSAMSKTIIYRGEGFPIATGGEYVNFVRLVSRLDELVEIREQTQ